MVRPCGARGFGQRWLMRSCVNVFGLRLEHVLRAIMDISAHAISLADRLRRAFRVTSVRTRREDRSSIIISSPGDREAVARPRFPERGVRISRTDALRQLVHST